MHKINLSFSVSCLHVRLWALWDPDSHQRSSERHGMKRVFIRCLFQTSFWADCVRRRNKYQYCVFLMAAMSCVNICMDIWTPSHWLTRGSKQTEPCQRQTTTFKVVHHQPNSIPSQLFRDFPHRLFRMDFWRSPLFWEVLLKRNPNSRRVHKNRTICKSRVLFLRNHFSTRAVTKSVHVHVYRRRRWTYQSQRWQNSPEVRQMQTRYRRSDLSAVVHGVKAAAWQVSSEKQTSAVRCPATAWMFSNTVSNL